MFFYNNKKNLLFTFIFLFIQTNSIFIIKSQENTDRNIIVALNSIVHFDIPGNNKKITFIGKIDKIKKISLVIQGSKNNFLLTKKNKNYGIWVKSEEHVLKDIPYFFILSNHNYIKKNNIDSLIKNNLFYKNDSLSEEIKNELFSYMKKKEMIKEEFDNSNFKFLGDNQLFFLTVNLPSDLPAGKFQTNFYLLSDDNKITSIINVPFEVRKTGFYLYIYNLSNNNKIFYAITSIFITLFIGFIFNLLWRTK